MAFNDKYKLLFLQTIAHVGLIYMLFEGQWFHWIVTFLIYFITGCFGITMTYHRMMSHKAWVGPPWWIKFGSLCGVWGIVGSPIAWVATHRAHHRDTDGPLDPHSPLHKSWWRVQWFSMFDEVSPKYAVEFLRDPFQLFLHRNYFLIHSIIIICLTIISPMFAVCCYLAPAAILWNAGSSINTITHLVGYRNFDTKDNSKCNFILGYLVFGEGWHNNHHANPRSDSFQTKWWEFDIGYFFIKLIRKD
jgi:stearoyl-CoA desaturase (delta-9 desaturase)